MFLFLLAMVVLLPIFMILIGRVWQKNPPKDINGFYGYRTSRSMKSKYAWNYAHRYYGRIWYYCGIILTPLSILAMFIFISNYESASIVIIMLQTLFTIIAIFPTEWSLKKHFDHNGFPINQNKDPHNESKPSIY